jgi:hypothetical protein
MANRKGRRQNRGRNANAVSNVRVVDEYAGTAGARVDRMLQALHNSESQIRVEIGAVVPLSTVTGSGDVTGVFSGFSLRAQDEWTSLIGQWQLFRVMAMRFDVYDINPNITTFAAFSTFHEASTTSIPAYTVPQILDGPDAQVPTNGAPRLQFTWLAKGTRELEFQAMDPAAEPVSDFGGIRYGFGAGTAAGSKFQIVVKAIVDFRGRY